MTGSTRRGFLIRTLLAGAAVAVRRMGSLFGLSQASASAARAAGVVPPPTGAPGLSHRPLLGHLAPTAVRIWARSQEPGSYTLAVLGGGQELVSAAESTAQRDHTLVWEIAGLEPGVRYRYEVRRGGRTIFSRDNAQFVTPLPQTAPAVTRLAVGSCAREEEGDRAVWRRIASLDPHAVVLLGDTPYIDSTDIAVQRRRYGEFVAVPEFAELLRSRPLYATWDDHDFGRNDTDGRLPGKENARQAFVEYHGNPSYGDGTEGIYTSFRMGGVEVFLLDTRWFAGTERSPIANGTTMLGRRQWEWLRDGLRASDAPFKLLASGLVWNGAVRPGKPDHWDSYPEERAALFRFLGEERISGVVLVGGDIHRTRVLRYPTEDVVGYPLTELITSPIHDGVIVDAKAPHPSLVFDSGTPHSFMLLTVDTTVDVPTLHARFIDSGGAELYAVTLDAATLRRG
ncbi:MAG: alkaline phosphatase family protein [Gemmatimonadetes bacterium]|nr:alkaline phosphatase family protein [Gemmatimonadota bacterium]